MNKLEILAPVGNKEMLFTAIANHADAVYLGLENFNARAKADNFNSHNIKEYIDLCHLYGIKVYITVNTLISDSEMDSVVDMVGRAHKAMADAFIIQDLGLAYQLKNKYPNIVLHASTQMGVCNVYGAKVLEKIGFSRVVVARETTLEDIKRIKKQTNLEIEAFVQGALCVCFSGSCYISSLLKNKSGNRGECLQLCRLPYKLIQNGQIKKQGYLLSPRDISLLSRLDEMIEAGVCSLKIEGRLRRSAYLAQAVTSVKNIIENKSTLVSEDCSLKKVFSRGEFNKGIYLDTKTRGGIINSEINNHLGIKIGCVLKVQKFKDIFEIQIRSTHKLASGDGLKFISSKEQQSLGVGNVKVLGNNEYIVYGKVSPGINADVYLTVDAKNEEALTRKERYIFIDAKVRATAGEKLGLTLKYNNIEVVACGQMLEKAIKNPVTKDQIAENISKLGETVFRINNIEVVTNDVFIAKSALNKIRREAVSLLIREIIKNYEAENCKTYIENMQNKSKTHHFNNKFNYYIISNREELDKVKDKHARIVFAPCIYENEKIKCIKNIVQGQFYTKLFLLLPTVANFADLKLLDDIIKSFKKDEIGLVAGSIYGLYYAFLGYEVVCGINMNISNTYSSTLINQLGAIGFVSSVEDNLFGLVEGGIKYIGNPAVMTLVSCPFIEHLGSSCDKCKYAKNYEMVMENNVKLRIRRQKMHDCYFELIKDKKPLTISGVGNMIDYRD